jgi:hypothetical protein
MSTPSPRLAEQEACLAIAPGVGSGTMGEWIMATLGEWLDVFMDLDAYIAKGGRLLDLQLLSSAPAEVEQAIADQLGTERLARLDSFFGRIAELVGNVLTEDQARAIWRESAEPTSETLH